MPGLQNKFQIAQTLNGTKSVNTMPVTIRALPCQP